MIVAITGSGGFIGKHLCAFFQTRGYVLRKLYRIHAKSDIARLTEVLEEVDIVVNLAGASINRRWTRKSKKIMMDSRSITTQKIVEAIKLASKKPKLLLSSSAVGIYAQEGIHTEKEFKLADDFLSEICQEWEREALKAMPYTRVCVVRFGVVLGKEGGILKRLIPLFKAGFGGRIGSGKQPMSWIHIYDVIKAIDLMIETETMNGIYNLTSPQAVTNQKFTRVLASQFNEPAFMAVTSWVLNLLYGEGAKAIGGGQNVLPQRLLDAGFKFNFPTLAEALDDIIHH